MIEYDYKAVNPQTGKKISSVVQADNKKSAAKLIKQQGLTPIEIVASEENKSFFKRKGKVSVKDKIIFSRQMATLVAAGLPLVQSLRNVFDQTNNKAFKSIISKVITDVEAGKAFSAALAKYPDTFDNVFINLVEAGEVSGTLDKSLERLAFQQEKDAEVLGKIKGAMVYPAIVLLVMVAVVVFMLVTVLPQVETLYDGLQGAGELPIFTRALLAVSNFIISFWYIILIIVGLIAFFGTRWAKTLGGRRVIDKIKLKAPLVSPLFMKLYMARFARTGTTMVAAGVPLIKTLEVIAGAINNVFVENSIKKASEKVRGGKALSEALMNDDNFLSLLPDMLKIGEDSGQVESMMERTAIYYEKELDNQIKTISTIIEPVMMVLLGVTALIIVAAVLLPIYGLAGKDIL